MNPDPSRGHPRRPNRRRMMDSVQAHPSGSALVTTPNPTFESITAILRSACLVTLAASLLAPPWQSLAAQDSEPDAILGFWETEPTGDERSRIEIYRCEDRYCGRIVWLSDPLVTEAGKFGEVGTTKRDYKNPDEEIRGRPIEGLELMHSFRFDDEKWKDGRIYDPENGKTYRCEIALHEDRAVLKVRGYIKVGFVKLGRTTEWTRVSAALPDDESSM